MNERHVTGMSNSDQNPQAAAGEPRPSTPRSQSQRRQPHPQLLSDRPDPGRAALHHVQPDLVVHQLGRRCRAAVHARRLPSRNLSAVQYSGHRPDHRVRDADAARLPDRQPGRAQAGRVRRAHSQPHADRAADLPQPQADLRDAVLEIRIELPPGRAGRVSGAGHVVDRVPVAAAERRRRGSASRQRAHLGVPAVHAESDHRLLLLSCRAATSSSSTSRSRPR